MLEPVIRMIFCEWRWKPAQDFQQWLLRVFNFQITSVSVKYRLRVRVQTGAVGRYRLQRIQFAQGKIQFPQFQDVLI